MKKFCHTLRDLDKGRVCLVLEKLPDEEFPIFHITDRVSKDEPRTPFLPEGDEPDPGHIEKVHFWLQH